MNECLSLPDSHKPTTMNAMLALLCVGVVCLMPRPTAGHGWLHVPPGRSSVWRFPQWKGMVPKNINDNELNCGGLGNQNKHGYKCGLCGDPVQGPRENEVGGKYANAQWRPIVANYTQGQEFPVSIRMTAHHKGWMSIKLCPTNDFSKEATLDCMEQHYATLPGGGTQYDMTVKHNWYNVTFVLPKDLTCDLCVLQWRYHAGNNWGIDPATGKGGQGLGPQEEFYGCADVSIKPNAPATPKPTSPAPTTPKPVTARPTTPRPTTTARPATQSPLKMMTFCKDYQLDDGVHIDPTSCKHYVECNKGHTVRMSCPQGTGFSPRYRTCDADFAC